MKRAALALALWLGAGLAWAQDEPSDPSELLNALLAGLGGFRELTGPELQAEVAEVGGVPFRQDVPLDYLDRSGLARYLRELVDEEYPEERARADARTLVAFDLLEPHVDLRRLRLRLLEENVVGFYDERPSRRRLYAVSPDRRLTPANQIVLAHELRHALQDQYAQVHGLLPQTVGDFDDRRLALLGLLEGDATLLMERFVVRRLPGAEGLDLDGLSLPAPPLAGAPPVLRDQLVLPYTTGLDFARALFRSGGWDALREAWGRPPASTEQVLHPEKYRAGEAPRPVSMTWTPAGGRLVNEGVLGEMLIRTLLGGDGAAPAAEGWGGDAFRVFDVAGKTLLVWRTAWDSPADAIEFQRALGERFQTQRGLPEPRGAWRLYRSGSWRFALGAAAGPCLVSSDDPALLETALRELGHERP